MKLPKITVIVPRLPPDVDGLGDYGLLLAKQLRQDFGVTSEFIIGDPNWSGGSEVEGFLVRKVASRSWSDLLELLPKNTCEAGEHTVLLHYVGYGYAKRGCPFWLAKGLKNWRKSGGNRKLVTMFHELYAFGAIWTSQFWTSPFQRSLATNIAMLSDSCLTSKKKYAEVISKLSRGKHSATTSLPVFSNIGEPTLNINLSDRARRLVIFGSGGPRGRVYKNSSAALLRTCRELEITEIYDIGAPLNFEIPAINGIKVTCLGVIPHQEISRVLSNSLVGFFNYPTEYLSKSGIFAAYCAHGVLTVGAWYEDQDTDQVEEGRHYWLGDRHEEVMTISSGQIIADNAYAWYQTHKLSVQAQSFMKHLGPE